ncbi:MAG TPA: GTP-binding protein [Nitrospirota bacterium]|nr:GTP-binding protein [Nitrospirota bacterium]
MKITVVCGLLGSGKTTFIKNDVRGVREKTAVLVNDFGSAGIDGEVISTGGIKTVELPSGCVCCTLKFDLITTIQRIVKQFSPERLLIEPSGVASPSGVLEALESAGFGGASVIGIIDVVEFLELSESGMYGNFFQDQIENSDIILLNKTDLAEKTLISATERMVGFINPLAVLLRTVNAVLDIPLPEAPAHRKIHQSDCHFRFETLSIRTQQKMDFATVSRAFNDIAGGKFGAVARAKALINTGHGPYRFDIVYGKVGREPFEKDIQDSRLVVIGEMLDRQSIERALLTGA